MLPAGRLTDLGSPGSEPCWSPFACRRCWINIHSWVSSRVRVCLQRACYAASQDSTSHRPPSLAPPSGLQLPSTLSDVFPGSALPVPGSSPGPPSVLDPSPCSCPHSKFLPPMRIILTGDLPPLVNENSIAPELSQMSPRNSQSPVTSLAPVPGVTTEPRCLFVPAPPSCGGSLVS